jgi:hypothetical protein
MEYASSTFGFIAMGTPLGIPIRVTYSYYHL